MNKSILIVFVILGTALAANVQPIPNFNIALLAQGSGGMTFGWYINSVYDNTGNKWSDEACASFAFSWGDDFGILSNGTSLLDSRQQSWVQQETPLYYDMSNQAVLYYDQAYTQVAFWVVNWTINFIEGFEVNQAILAKNDTKGGYIFFGLTSVGILEKGYYDITAWLKAHGVSNIVMGQNYYVLDNICQAQAPTLALKTWTHPDQILGTWNVLAVYDTNQIYSWNDSQCAKINYANGPDHLYEMQYAYRDAKGNHSTGNFSLINDPNNATVYYGYFFGDYTSEYTTLEVIYSDLVGNMFFISEDMCLGIFISKKSTSISSALLQVFKGYLNEYSHYLCRSSDTSAYYYPNNSKC